MRPAFSRTLRALDRDRRLHPLAVMMVVAALMAGWAVWIFGATVTVVRSSTSARVEARHPAVRVDPPVAGEIVDNHLVLGRSVRAGEVLVVLDATAQQLERDELLLRDASLGRQLEAVELQLEAERAAHAAAQEVTRSATATAKAQRGFSRALSRIAAEEAERTDVLESEALVSRMDFLTMRGENLRSRREARATALEAETAAAARRLDELHLDTELKRLERERANLRGARDEARARIARLELELERRVIRAPIAGRVVLVVEAPAGTFVEAGQSLGRIVSDAGIRVVAEFPPSAVGRIQPGRVGQLRLDNYPWTQYGTVALEVTHVASEPIEGLVRVEMQPGDSPSIELEHGLTGTVEIELEQVSPAVLVLRAAGQMLAGSSPSSEDGPQQRAQAPKDPS